MSADDGASVDNIGDRRYASGYSTGHAEGMEEVLRMMASLDNEFEVWTFGICKNEVHWWLTDDESRDTISSGKSAQSLIDYLKRECGK